MCGIAGLVNIGGESISPPVLQRMTDSISHRGPDGEGHWIEGNVGIGHRRLSIIDVTPAGHQPMMTPDDRYVLSYNGEIYNFRELRIELEALGHVFNSNSDTEVVLHSFAQWGTVALSRFNGMFAVALWDRKQRKLLLARDRYGIKPLYYCLQGNRLAFASEQKAILASDLFKRDLDKEALLEYFTFQNIFTNRTLLKDVRILKAGHYCTFSLNQEPPRLEEVQYWDYRFREPEYPASKEEYIEELDRLFSQAVNRQLVSDVEL